MASAVRKVKTDQNAGRSADRQRRPRPSTQRLAARSRSTTSAITSRTRRRSRTPNTTRCAARYNAIEARFPGSAHAGIAVAEGRRRAVAEASPKCATRCRCCRSTTPSARRTSSISSPASAASSTWARTSRRLHRRAEDRRAVDVAALRGRRTGHRRHPRRRRRGRGRHRQYPHAQGRAAAAQGQGRARQSARCAARST